jgi:protein-disulfide isomerase
MIRMATPRKVSRACFASRGLHAVVSTAVGSASGIALGFVCAVAMLAGAPGSAQAQARAPAPDVTQRMTQLERDQMDLKAEVAALRERLDALLGPSADSRPVKLLAGNAPVRGNPDAAITLVLFGDYQSVYSVRAYYVVKRLLEDYPTAIRVVYKQYPLPPALHPQALDAALAAIAAERQGKFWELTDLLYQNSRRLDATLYPVLADQAGLNLAQFEKDRRSPDAQARLSEDEQSAVGASVPGVPALFLNGRMLPQWRYDYVRAQIEALRKK